MDEWHIIEVNGKQVWRRKGDVRYVIIYRELTPLAGKWKWELCHPNELPFITAEDAMKYLIEKYKKYPSYKLEQKNGITKSWSATHPLFIGRSNHPEREKWATVPSAESWEYKVIKEGEDLNG